MGLASETVLVSGGGIGGLSAALSLAGQGFAVKVFEQAPVLGEIGAGIQLSPNCTRVLFDLGLEERLRDIAFIPDAGEMRDWKSGAVLTTTPFGVQAVQAYGFPYLHVHRADLIAVLAGAVLERDDITMVTGATAVSFLQDETTVSLTVSSGGKDIQHSGSLLVGADGIRSVVRSGLFGAEAPTFTGNVAWRALVPVERLPADFVRPMATAWWGPRKHFVHYYVRRGELVNCVCVVEKAGWEIESWSEPGEYAELKADFAGWHDGVQRLIDNATKDSLFKWALFDRAPMRRWGKGRVTLLGDACHPTLPFMAQGAAMAIEDGAVLARCVCEPGPMSGRLRRYEDLRRERTAGIQSGSRRNARVFHLSGMQAWARNQALKAVRPNPMDWVYRYDALTAHRRS